MPRPRRALGSKSPTGWKAFRRPLWAGPDRWRCGWWTAACRFRSPRAASRYVDSRRSADAREDGAFSKMDSWIPATWSNCGAGRYYFAGRRGGVINVGGLKIHPEEVEAVINRHPAVRLSRVSGRRNPITGAIVIAEVVLDDGEDRDKVQNEILRDCRASLKPFQVPAMVRVVAEAGIERGRKVGASCVTFWLPAVRAASAWPLPGSWSPTAIASLPWRARRPRD